MSDSKLIIGGVATNDEVVKQVVLQVYELNYSIDISYELRSIRREEDFACMREIKERRVTHGLLNHLAPLIKCSTPSFEEFGKNTVTAKIFLPYVYDEEMKRKDEIVELAGISSQESLAIARDFSLRNTGLNAELNALKRLWFVRLYITVKEWCNEY